MTAVRQPWRRIWIFLCCISLIFTSSSWAREQKTLETAATEFSAPKHTSSQTDGTKSWPRKTSQDGSRGAVLVQQALTELRSIQGPKGGILNFGKRSGLLGSTVYYAKEAFVLLFMNGPSYVEHLSAGGGTRRLSKPLARAVQLLEMAAEDDNGDALFLLAEINFHGNHTHPRNFSEAFRRYDQLAALTGNSSAQHMVGFMYATGIGDAVKQDQAKALVYHTFAAQQDDIKSQMTLAYRHHAGIGVPKDCNEAAKWYKKVADKAIAYYKTGPPDGQSLARDSYRLADENGGVYGEGASVVSSGKYANRGGPNSDQNADIEDVLEYLDLLSRKGELKATLNLGRLHYDGSRPMKRDTKTARSYFLQVARKYWAKDNSVISDDINGVGKVASKAAAYLGRMHLRGEGTEQNFEKALKWFRLGLKNGDSFCQYHVGLMYLHGLGVRQDTVIASNYFKEAAQQDSASAQVQLGRMFLDQGDVTTALVYFDLAGRQGHIEALYYLAEINNNGVGRQRSCTMATIYHKSVAEKVEVIHSSLEEANRAGESGDTITALVGYMMAAEQGYEHAQANVAYMLDEHKSIFSLDALLPWKKKPRALLRNAMLALVYWTRSAKQDNIDSMVKMGDYYLGGYGVEKDVEKAAACYQSANELRHSAQAKWNLGWMHENGVGVAQDFHLAKRFYDQALETSQESYLPVKLSLMKLRARSYWNTITNGKVNSIQPEPAQPRKHRSWSEWLADFLAEEEHHDYAPFDADDDMLDSHLHDAMPGGDDLYDDLDDGMMESLVILSIAGALALLIYYRQLRQPNQQRAAAERQQNHPLADGEQADGGFFPPRDDPNFGPWVAGGVGH